MKILFLKGLPASGKSTYAKELAKDPSWVRVNKDDIRAMLYDSKFSKVREKIVEDMQILMAINALESGLNVIVDNTHFSPRHEAKYRELAETYKAEFELKYFDTSVEECIKRDQARTNSVGKDVILRMFYSQNQVYTAPTSQTAFIFDIDGTLAIMQNRGAYEWERVGEDVVNNAVRTVLRHIVPGGHRIIILSGRDSICRPQTEKWLRDNEIPYDDLYMRPKGNTEKDTVVKKALYDEHIKNKYNVIGVFDDRPCMVRLWRSLGLFCFDCGNGIEF